MNYLSRWDNPIFQRELLASERATRRHRRRSIGLVIALITILSLLFALLLVMYPSAYGQQFIWMFFPAWAVWVIYAVAVLQTIIASAGIVNAEHIRQTWEPMILTGISTRRILIGNWLAALHRVRGWILFLALARIVVLPIYRLVSAKVAAAACGYYFYCFLQSPSTNVWILAIGITIVLTIVDILCCALIGLAAGAAIHHSGFAVVVAILIRFAPLFVFFAFGYDDANFWAWWAAPAFALVDGGTAPAVQLIMPLLPDWIHFNPLLGLVLITAALAILLPIALTTTFLILRHNRSAR